MTLLEICLDDIDGVLIAETHGAARVELCAALIEGGTTPSIGTFEAALDATSTLGIQVLVRQRGGDFVYSRLEIDAMCRDIAAMRAAASRRSSGQQPHPRVGFVIGALTPSGALDVPAMQQLKNACGAYPATCHKAFDQVPDLPAALESLIELGCERVLTSGGPGNAGDNIAMLKALVRQGAGRIDILVGGGVRAHNVRHIVQATGAREVHLRAQESMSSPSVSPNAYDSGQRLVTSGRAITELQQQLSA